MSQQYLLYTLTDLARAFEQWRRSCSDSDVLPCLRSSTGRVTYSYDMVHTAWTARTVLCCSLHRDAVWVACRVRLSWVGWWGRPILPVPSWSAVVLACVFRGTFDCGSIVYFSLEIACHAASLTGCYHTGSCWYVPAIPDSATSSLRARRTGG